MSSLPPAGALWEVTAESEVPGFTLRLRDCALIDADTYAALAGTGVMFEAYAEPDGPLLHARTDHLTLHLDGFVAYVEWRWRPDGPPQLAIRDIPPATPFEDLRPLYEGAQSALDLWEAEQERARRLLIERYQDELDQVYRDMVDEGIRRPSMRRASLRKQYSANYYHVLVKRYRLRWGPDS